MKLNRYPKAEQGASTKILSNDSGRYTLKSKINENYLFIIYNYVNLKIIT